MYCSKCGNEIPDTANFCPCCAAQLNEQINTVAIKEKITLKEIIINIIKSIVYFSGAFVASYALSALFLQEDGTVNGGLLLLFFMIFTAAFIIFVFKKHKSNTTHQSSPEKLSDKKTLNNVPNYELFKKIKIGYFVLLSVLSIISLFFSAKFIPYFLILTIPMCILLFLYPYFSERHYDATANERLQEKQKQLHAYSDSVDERVRNIITSMKQNESKIEQATQNYTDMVEANKNSIAYRDELDKQLIAMVDYMSGEAFERYIGYRLAQLGWTKIQYTPASNDYGADVIATDVNGITTCIQCKRYAEAVGISAVQEVCGAMSYYRCQRGIVATNNFFTTQAQELAQKTGVYLWDRKSLLLPSSPPTIDSYVTTNITNNDTYEEITEDVIDTAAKTVIEMQMASTTILQRKMTLGYAKAARLVDKLESLGVVGEFEGAKPRKVLMTLSEWENVKNNSIS